MAILKIPWMSPNLGTLRSDLVIFSPSQHHPADRFGLARIHGIRGDSPCGKPPGFPERIGIRFGWHTLYSQLMSCNTLTLLEFPSAHKVSPATKISQDWLVWFIESKICLKIWLVAKFTSPFFVVKSDFLDFMVFLWKDSLGIFTQAVMVLSWIMSSYWISTAILLTKILHPPLPGVASQRGVKPRKMRWTLIFTNLRNTSKLSVIHTAATPPKQGDNFGKTQPI